MVAKAYQPGERKISIERANLHLKFISFCSLFRRSDSGARAKTKVSERAGKNALLLALFFARAPLSERLEQAIAFAVIGPFLMYFWERKSGIRDSDEKVRDAGFS